MSNIKNTREIIMKHYRSPEFSGSLTDSNKYQSFSNRCVDNTTLYINGTIKIDKIKHTSEGCSAFLASTDLLCKTIENMPKEDVVKLIDSFVSMINGNEFDEKILGDLIAFENIGKQMNRAECALTPAVAINKWISNTVD